MMRILFHIRVLKNIGVNPSPPAGLAWLIWAYNQGKLIY